MRGLVALNLRHARAHPFRLLLSVMTLAVATALVVSAAGLVTSTRESVDRTVSALTGAAEIEVAGRTDGGFDAAVLDKVAAVPGVALAAPIVSTTVLVSQRRTLLVGVDASALGLLGGDRDLKVVGSSPGDVAVTRHLARGLGASPGDRIDVVGAAGVRSVQIATTLGGPLDDVSGGDVIVTTVALAQEIAARPARLNSILVKTERPGEVSEVRARLEAAVDGRAEIADPGGERRAASVALDGVNQALFAMAALAAVVAGFVVFNTMSMSALERRREFAIQRALGAPRRSLLLRFLVEASLIGVAGAVPGSAIGLWLARALVDGLPPAVRSMVETKLEVVLPGWVIGAAVASSVFVAVLASVMPARAAMSVPPAEALRPDGLLAPQGDDARTRRPLLLAASATFVLGVVLALNNEPRLSAVAGTLVVLGAVSMMFAAAHGLASGTSRIASLFRSPGRLAAESISRSPRRLWTTTATVMLAVAITLAIGETSSNVRSSAADTLRPIQNVRLLVQTAPADDLALDVAIPAEAREAIAALPGVRRFVPGRFAFAFIDGRRVLVQAAGPGSNTPLLRLAGASALRKLTSADAVVLSSQLAKDQGVGVGDRFELPTAQGRRTVEVAGVAPSFLWPGGVIGMDFRRFQTWFGPAGPTFAEVTIAPGTNVGDLRRAIDAVPSDVPLYVYDGSQLYAAGLENIAQIQALLAAFQWIVVVAASLAILNTLIISLLQRTRQLGMMRAIGMTRRGLVEMVVAETFAIVVVGMAAGIIVGLLQHRVMVTLSASSGFPTIYSVALSPFFVTILAGAFMGLAGGVIPAIRVGRTEIVAAIAYE